MSFTIQRILGIAPVIIGLFLLTPTPGLAQFAKPDLVVNLLNPAPPATGKPGDSWPWWPTQHTREPSTPR